MEARRAASDHERGMRLSLRKGRPPESLADLHAGEEAVLDVLDLPKDDALRLMELGFLPGNRVAAARHAPGGDPRVFRVDGAEIALRKETARRLRVAAPRMPK